MSLALLVLVVLAVAGGIAAGWWLAPHRRRAAATRPDRVRRILLPFTGGSISKRAFDAAVRLARVEHATLMPCYLATVPLHLPVDAPLPRRCLSVMPLLEAIEQRAAAQDVDVDARIVPGRSYRDALRRALAGEPVDRVIVSATSNAGEGFGSDDLVWLLQKADAEVLILRPAPEDHRLVSGNGLVGHF
ncbi:MAG TPA: universal stress protein [Solirubrobacteraceae bacterium]|nr:universal stress protein [Solirubrobacteraceae bacterium]